MAERLQALVAVHLFLIKADEVLLARRYNTGYHDGDYSVPAGHVDKGETVTTAMLREAKEEVGVEIEPSKLNFSTIMHRYSDDKSERIDFFFTCSEWSGEPKICEPNKCDELKWVKATELPGNTIDYVRKGVDCYLKGNNFSEYGWENKLD